MHRNETLNRAIELTTKHRDADYGSPSANGLAIAKMWSAYLGIDVKPHDVFQMMVLVKVCRSRHSPSKSDHYTDIAGYAACASEVAGAKPPDSLQKVLDNLESLSAIEKKRVLEVIGEIE